MNLAKKQKEINGVLLYLSLYILSVYIVLSVIYTSAKIVWFIIHKIAG